MITGIIPTGFHIQSNYLYLLKVGMLFKAIPERVFDLTLGDDAFSHKNLLMKL